MTAKALITTLAMMAAQGTLLALVAFALARGGRLRPAWQASVWLVVLIKFVLPWGPAMPWSLADLIAMARGSGEATVVIAAPVLGAEPAPAAAAAGHGWTVLAMIWAAGTAVVLARALIADLRTRRAARRAGPAPAEVQAQLAELAGRLRVRTPRLVVGDGAVGPHVVGLVRATIVIPPRLLGDDPALIRAALGHELAHVRRRDALARVVQIAATALFWFWPVVRIASRRLESAREAACDAWALELAGVSRPAYARLLVHMAQLRVAAAPALAAPHALDDRVTAVLGPPVRARIGLGHRLIWLAWIAVALGGARSASARGERSVCLYTPQLAEALRLAHPEADLDGDGVLSRGEACDYQAEVRRRVETQPADVVLDVTTSELLAEPLCCNCGGSEARSSPGDPGIESTESCYEDEGADR